MYSNFKQDDLLSQKLEIVQTSGQEKPDNNESELKAGDKKRSKKSSESKLKLKGAKGKKRNRG